MRPASEPLLFQGMTHLSCPLSLLHCPGLGHPIAHLPSGWPHSSAPLVYYPPSYNPSKVHHGLQALSRAAAGLWHMACLPLQAHLLPAQPGPTLTWFLTSMQAAPLFGMPFLFYSPLPLEWLSSTHIILLKSGSTSSKDPPHTHMSTAWALGLL